MRKIETLIAAAEHNRPDEELREGLQKLVADFRPHAAPVQEIETQSLPQREDYLGAGHSVVS